MASLTGLPAPMKGMPPVKSLGEKAVEAQT
jgi:hypothetical protein